MCRKTWNNWIKYVCLLVLATFVYCTTAQARVCFLPGGKCPGKRAATSLKGIQGDQCLGYNLTQVKCKGQACEIGWDCESCTNAQGTFYKCTKKPTPEGFTPGLEKCPSPCQQYTWNGFTGNQINGKCESIPDYTATKPNPCRTYLAPDYTCGASIVGADVGDLTKENGGCTICYTNIVEMSGYTTTKPASCTTYNSKRNGLGLSSDTMCYTSGTSIGENFSTAERDSDAFIVETKYGVDTFIALSGAQTKKNTEACYRATGCNTANGWLKSTDVDGSKFEYLEKSSDGIVCRKAIACRETNNWFNHEKLGQYKNKHFSTTEETRSGLTCYRADSCNTKAYTTQPDARFFTFDKKTSNGHTCWIVTGKADYAYNEGEKKTNMFDYTSATAYLNGTDTQVTYWIVNKDNGRNGCMQYAYESQPDTKYFTSVSAVQYSNGSSTTKTCWNITGKGTYAYGESDKLTHFAYDSGKSGYLNGTSTTVKYYNVTGCGTYAYSTQPDAKYFSFEAKEQYKGGVNNLLKCWNVTGKGQYAYTESEKQTDYFTYDSGSTAYLNGTSSKGTYYNVTGCAAGASASPQNTGIFTVGSNEVYKNGTSAKIKCYRAIGCAITDTNPGACKTFSKSTEGNVTCYYGISTTGASDCTITKPVCRTWTKGTDTNGNTVYYNISAAFGNDCVLAENRSHCYNYTTKKDTDGTVWYYNPSLMATGATSVKPSVTNSNCHTFSSGTPSSNGTSTTCYWNDKTPTMEAVEAKCGTCGYKTRTATCADNGTGWSYGVWGSCTETAKGALEQKCGTCGYQTRTATCTSSGKSWSYSAWSGCTETKKEVVSEACGCGGTRTRTATCASNGKSWSYGGWGTCQNGACNSGSSGVSSSTSKKVCIKGCGGRYFREAHNCQVVCGCATPGMYCCTAAEVNSTTNCE